MVDRCVVLRFGRRRRLEKREKKKKKEKRRDWEEQRVMGNRDDTSGIGFDTAVGITYYQGNLACEKTSLTILNFANKKI